jgi:hypothetical protein
MTWQSVIVENGLSIADAATSVTIDLPRSNRIGDITAILRGTGGSGTPAVEALISKIEVIANGNSSIISATNQQLRDIMQLKKRGTRAEIVNATGAASRVATTIMFGRYKHDPLVILPAYLFSTLQLKITFATLIATTAFVTGTVKLDIFVDESIPEKGGIADKDLIIQKITEVESFTSAASGEKKIRLQRGHMIAGLYMRAAGTDGATITDFMVKLNNGSVIPVASTWLKSQNDDIIDYGLTGSAKLANVTIVDFDNPATAQIMGEVIDTGAGSGVLDADLILNQGAASQACSVVQLTYVPVINL